MPNYETEEARRSALAALRSAGSFLLVGHERPDGDCLGSQAALAQVLRRLGKSVVIQNPDPPAPQFHYLAGEGAPFTVWNGKEVPEHEVCILLDFNEIGRSGPMADALRAAPSKKLIIDHHPLGDSVWWDEAFVDVSASATGVLVHRIAHLLEVDVDPLMARAVFTSMVTDTGWFRYSNTDGETLAAAAELVEHGVVPADLFRSIHQQLDPEEPLAIANLLGRTEYFAGGRLAVVDLPLPAEGEPRLEEPDVVLDILRSVGSVEVVLFLREREDGRVKLSARSKTSYDVNALARGFGGGGHVKASGATIQGSLADVRARLIAAAEEGFGREAASA
ncbi:MAG: bifunctional oligoribonuclease/PAP phosphatase NrnA [Planctomycetota bacterium]